MLATDEAYIHVLFSVLSGDLPRRAIGRFEDHYVFQRDEGVWNVQHRSTEMTHRFKTPVGAMAVYMCAYGSMNNHVGKFVFNKFDMRVEFYKFDY